MNESSTSTIGARIKLAREVLNMSRHDLARLINTCSHNIAGWEGDTYEPSLSHIVPLAKALKCNASWLLGEDEIQEELKRLELKQLEREVAVAEKSYMEAKRNNRT
ncbi:TPA: hypothetical protein IMJ33_005688 [Salmonella enterica]|nr:hypothetical protein [Salmonella enterica]